MPEKEKIGIIACSGEDVVGGTITRAAARMVVETLRPDKTVILCQPLFMAGGLERHGGTQEREFAKTHPTIAVDGCAEECARIAVMRYSGSPRATISVEDVLKEHPELKPSSRESLNGDGITIAEILANKIAKKVDELYEQQ